jgi:uncharacterized membrane protein
MNKNRMEAFSDGVFAIILTIMVLELKVPQDATMESFRHLGTQLLSYVLSFAYVAIYWNNHHHMLHGIRHVNGPILWANMTLLFFLSLFPFCTAWVGESHVASLPMAFYGCILLAAGMSYNALFRCLLDLEGPDSVLARARSRWLHIKSRLGEALYALGVLVAFWEPRLSFGLYSFVAMMWLMPDKRIEELVSEEEGFVRPSKRSRG